MYYTGFVQGIRHDFVPLVGEILSTGLPSIIAIIIFLTELISNLNGDVARVICRTYSGSPRPSLRTTVRLSFLSQEIPLHFVGQSSAIG